MKLDFPFHGSRKQVLAKMYHVQAKPAPVREISRKELLRVGAASVLLAVLMFALLVLWPISERLSR